MSAALPLGAFKDAPYAVLLSDERGRVRVCNAPASALLGMEPELAVGRPCWQVAGFEGEDGGRLCGPDCSIQRQARAGHVEPFHQVVVRDRGRPAVRVELLTILIPPPWRGRHGALHLLLPRRVPGAAGERTDGAARAEAPSPLLGRLSAREAEVLRLLARGLGTAAVASTLRVSPATVRTHVQNLLKKLGVHRRIDAVLALLGQARSSNGAPASRRRDPNRPS